MISPPSQSLNPQVYKKFIEAGKTRPNVDRDFPEWHLGRKEYSLWGISLKSEEIKNRLEIAKALLQEFLITPYSSHPHITLFICGFLSEQCQHYDDFSYEQIDLQIEEIRAKALKPFEIKIGGINSFSVSPFLEVEDTEGGIKNIRKALSVVYPENPHENFVPHLTFGLYAGEFSTKKIANNFMDLGPKLPYKVESIDLLSYKATDIHGPLRVERVIKL